MAYTSRDFLKDLAIYSTGAAIGIKNTAKFTSYAAKKGIQLAGVGVARASPSIGSAALTAGRTGAALAAANPVSTGLGLGLGFTQTPTGQALLEAAAERGAADRMALDQYIDDKVRQATTIVTSPMVRAGARSTVRRKVRKYNGAVKAGMAVVRKSSSYGKKGTINNAKKAFSAVNKVTSAVNKGKKVATKGIRGSIARAARRILR